MKGIYKNKTANKNKCCMIESSLLKLRNNTKIASIFVLFMSVQIILEKFWFQGRWSKFTFFLSLLMNAPIKYGQNA